MSKVFSFEITLQVDNTRSIHDRLKRINYLLSTQDYGEYYIKSYSDIYREANKHRSLADLFNSIGRVSSDRFLEEE
jgi:hypothetical protein